MVEIWAFRDCRAVPHRRSPPADHHQELMPRMEVDLLRAWPRGSSVRLAPSAGGWSTWADDPDAGPISRCATPDTDDRSVNHEIGGDHGTRKLGGGASVRSSCVAVGPGGAMCSHAVSLAPEPSAGWSEVHGQLGACRPCGRKPGADGDGYLPAAQVAVWCGPWLLSLRWAASPRACRPCPDGRCLSALLCLWLQRQPSTLPVDGNDRAGRVLSRFSHLSAVA